VAMAIIGRRQIFSSTKNKPPVMIFASEVPVIAKLNKYREIEDVFYSVWQRTNPDQVEKLEGELMVPSAEEKMNQLVLESGAKRITERALEQSAVLDSTKEINDITNTMKSEISDLENVDEEKKANLIKHFKSEIQKGYGSRAESTAIQHYEAKEKVQVKNSNVHFHKKKIGTITFDGRDVLVGGRIDGQVGENRVVEVKNRMRRFMNPLPAYDIAQLQTYLYILDSPEGELVEHLRQSSSSSSSDARTRSTVIPRDEGMWNERILPDLMSFSESLAMFANDPERQRLFLRSDDGQMRKNIIRSFHGSEASEGTSISHDLLERNDESKYKMLRVPQLKDLCRQRKLTVGGLKQQLIDRLEEYDRGHDGYGADEKGGCQR